MTKSKFYSGFYRFFNKVKKGYYLLTIGSFLYLISFHYRHLIFRLLNIKLGSNHWMEFLKEISHALNEFCIHYFPDLIAAGTIYFSIDEGLKILIGTREEKNRSYQGVKSNFLSAKREIKILDTYINNIVDEATRPEFEKLLNDLITNGLRIKILLLNPDTEGSVQRIADLEQSGYYRNRILKDEIRNNLALLFNVQESLKRNLKQSAAIFSQEEIFDVRLYDKTPPMSYYSWDNTSYFSLITPDRPTEYNTNLIISKLSLFGIHADKVFDEIWNTTKRAGIIRLENYMTGTLPEDIYKIHEFPKRENCIYFGFALNQQNEFPTHLTTNKFSEKINNLFLKNIHHKIKIAYRGFIYEVMILKAIHCEEQPSLYEDALGLLNSFYDIDRKNSRTYLEFNDIIYEIRFLVVKLDFSKP